jgi:3'-phosphoadenosine 5'-phosphosulfate sulfotransferase (PAPS reductase)/FAD synthetase
MTTRTISMFEDQRTTPKLCTTPAIDRLLATGAPVAFGVSGGKDSTALVLSGNEYLDSVGHSGSRVLIHSDLGRVEWSESLPQCERLAKQAGLELIVVQRASGGMMERWLTRWANNVARYANLECVKLILPWSTASMRFCTSELKTAIICRELVKRFPNSTIISAAGIRADESPNRAKAEICKPQNKLTSVAHNTTGLDWLPIHAWTLDDVWAIHDHYGFPRHMAYQTNSRVSCKFCILGSQADLLGTTLHEESHDLYREQVGLEIESTFSFQDGHWLGDIAPQLLDERARQGLAQAKRRAAHREAAEAHIPPHLLYTAGWPTCMPDRAEAALLANIRREVADAVGLEINYTKPDELRARYAELMAARPGEMPIPEIAHTSARQELLLTLENDL